MTYDEQKEFITMALINPLRDLKTFLDNPNADQDQTQIAERLLEAVSFGDWATISAFLSFAMGELNLSFLNH